GAGPGSRSRPAPVAGPTPTRTTATTVARSTSSGSARAATSARLTGTAAGRTDGRPRRSRPSARDQEGATTMTILIPATDPRSAAERAAAASVSTAENDVLRRVNSAHQRQGLERVEITGSIRYQYVRDAACARYLGTVGALSPLFATR